jgi:hypothetical protein
VTATAKITGANLSDYALEKYFAPKLSDLDVCGAQALPEMEQLGATLQLNIIFTLPLPDFAAVLVQNFVGRFEVAIEEYSAARLELNRYIVGLPTTRSIRAYERSVGHFENCLFHLYLSILSINRLLELIDAGRLFELCDGSPYDRLRELFNRVKHFDEDITTGQSEPLRPIWITNDGLECARASLRFSELFDLIKDQYDSAKWLAIDLPKKVAQIRADKGLSE